MIDINKKDCVGCYTCSSICPKNFIFMKSEKEVFEYPKVNEESVFHGNTERIAKAMLES